jgi:Calcineurin-like phosphoesterase
MIRSLGDFMPVATWNISSGVFEPGAAPSLESRADYIGECIANSGAELVALQECPLPRTADELSFVRRIKSKANLSYSEVRTLSESHLLPDADMGLAILSRFPLSNITFGLFDIPEMAIAKSPNPEAKLHRKGYLAADVILPIGAIRCITAHLPPFRWLEEEPGANCFEAMWRDLDRAIAGPEMAVVALLDCNLPNPLDYLRECRNRRLTQCVHRPTRPTGELHDHIILSPDQFQVLVGVQPTRSDHSLVTARLAARSRGAPSRRAKFGVDRATLILHLSDLHFGPGTAEDVDWKEYVPLATRETRRDILTQYLRSLPEPPDFVIVSGDLTIAGREEGLQEFRETILELCEAGHLPGPNHILVVPGNHDLSRVKHGDLVLMEARWANFRKNVSDFARPLLSFDLQTESETIVDVRRALALQNEAVEQEGTSAERISFASLPFILDRNRGILIYGFNSASVSGSQLDLTYNVSSSLQKLLGKGVPPDSDLARLAAELDNERWIDPARIDPVELRLFKVIIGELQKQVPGFDKFIKLAVLHHHVSPVIPEEVTKFEALTNAGRFKSELAGAGFEVILHGHKHWPSIEVELGAGRNRSQIIVSGGTIGGGASLGTEPGFYWLRFPPDRRSLEASFVPLQALGSPATGIENALVAPKSFPLGVSHASYASLNRVPLAPLLSRSERSLLANVRNAPGADGEGLFGWSHALSEGRVSVVATAYGVLCLDLIGSKSQVAQEAVRRAIATLLKLQNADGGWSASSQSNVSYPEPTAFVIDALATCADLELGPYIDTLEEIASQDAVLWRSTYCVCKIAQTLRRRRPQSALLNRCVNILRDGALRDHEGRICAWPKCLPDSEASQDHPTEPSVLHTAHALLALTLSDASAEDDELDVAADWLTGRVWVDTSEDINRKLPNAKFDKLVVKHFTAPWALMATIQCAKDPPTDRLIAEVKKILHAHDDGLWDWGDTKRPIWATHDALKALTLYALANL